MSGRLFGSMFEVVNGNLVGDSHTIETALADTDYYPASGNFIDVSHAERVHVLIKLSTLAAVGTFKLYEHDSATGTPTEIDDTNAWYTHTITADDDDQFAVITLEVSRMSLDHHFLTTLVNESGSNYASVTYLLERYGELPPTSTAMPTASQHYCTE